MLKVGNPLLQRLVPILATLFLTLGNGGGATPGNNRTWVAAACVGRVFALRVLLQHLIPLVRGGFGERVLRFLNYKPSTFQ